MNDAKENTDRELWREREGDYYADSIHVTKDGAIGINCGGTVYVKTLRAWHDSWQAGRDDLANALFVWLENQRNAPEFTTIGQVQYKLNQLAATKHDATKCNEQIRKEPSSEGSKQ